MLSSKPLSLSESCLSAIHHANQPSWPSVIMTISHHTYQPSWHSSMMPIGHHTPSPCLCHYVNQPSCQSATPSASQKSGPSSIIPISHYANQPLCPPPLFSYYANLPSCWLAIMPISHYAYQPPCPPPSAIIHISNYQLQKRLLNYKYPSVSPLPKPLSLSEIMPIIPISYPPFSYYANQQSCWSAIMPISHYAYQPQCPHPL